MFQAEDERWLRDTIEDAHQSVTSTEAPDPKEQYGPLENIIRPQTIPECRIGVDPANALAVAQHWYEEAGRWSGRHEWVRGWCHFLLWLVGLETCALLLFLVAWGSR